MPRFPLFFNSYTLLKTRRNLGNAGSTQVEYAAMEAMALKRVPIELRRQEADLFETKWFDMRPLHPVAATYYYADCYAKATRRFCEITLDRDRAGKARIIEVNKLFEHREATAVVTARQHLDRIGCRYDWALTFIVGRYSDRGWHGMPRPNQLYGEELMLDVADAWRLECAASLQVPKADLFRLAPGAALTHTQRDYMNWVFAQVRIRGTDAWRPLSRLLREEVVLAAEVEREFGPVTLQKALKASGR